MTAFIETVITRNWQLTDGWETFGAGLDVLQMTKFEFAGETFTVLRDHECTTLVFDQREFAAFAEGVRNGEFDFAGAVREKTEGEEVLS
ncbi:hypothetical protein [Amycolatopsis samaneae]|uniref:Uncharacterized protein n=1 Tax=Amycolatopsis samaneae TaxID=664691 RepID=A0ABW5GBV3_9PSEU